MACFQVRQLELRISVGCVGLHSVKTYHRAPSAPVESVAYAADMAAGMVELGCQFPSTRIHDCRDMVCLGPSGPVEGSQRQIQVMV
jgi:hypothetical protein